MHKTTRPEVIIDYRLFPNDGYQRTYRDRHCVLRGYAVCEDFYSPDYSRKPLPDTKDYRRTLLWIPEVKFDEKGSYRTALQQQQTDRHFCGSGRDYWKRNNRMEV